MMGLDLLADVFNRVRKKRKDLIFLSIKSLTLGMDPTEMRHGLKIESNLISSPSTNTTLHHGLLVVVVLVAALAHRAVTSPKTSSTAL